MADQKPWGPGPASLLCWRQPSSFLQSVPPSPGLRASGISSGLTFKTFRKTILKGWHDHKQNCFFFMRNFSCIPALLIRHYCTTFVINIKHCRCMEAGARGLWAPVIENNLQSHTRLRRFNYCSDYAQIPQIVLFTIAFFAQHLCSTLQFIDHNNLFI